MVNQIITNKSNVEHLVEVYPILETGRSGIKPQSFSNNPFGVILHREDKMIYLSSFNLARGSMLPASGEAEHNWISPIVGRVVLPGTGCNNGQVFY